MILPNFVLPSRVNQTWSYSGMDSLESCFDKKHFESYPYDITYNYNSRGFRDAEWPDSMEELQEATWCVGDSFTVGIGSPIEHTWPSVLQQQTGRRTVNVSMDGASNNWIARRSIDIIQSINPKTLIIHWSYIERREQPGKYLDQAWTQFYANIRAPHWPENVNLENFNALPTHIQNEILTEYGQEWKCGLSDEQLRLPYIKSTNEEDVENTIRCIESVNQSAKSTRVVHSFIPQFVNKSYKHLFDSQLANTSNSLIIPEFKPVDIARDGHHYDIKTATNFVELIIKLGDFDDIA
jgi:hypothetical protein